MLHLELELKDQINKRNKPVLALHALRSVASCASDQILGGVFLATCGDLSASLPGSLS